MRKKCEIIYLLSEKDKRERRNRVGERMNLSDESERIINLEDAEREAIATIRKRTYSKIENLFLKSSDLTQVGGQYAYVIRARVDTVAKGRFRRGKVETQDVEVLINASSGECMGFKSTELEE